MSAPVTPSIDERFIALIAELESLRFAVAQLTIPPAGSPPITSKSTGRG